MAGSDDAPILDWIGRAGKRKNDSKGNRSLKQGFHLILLVKDLHEYEAEQKLARSMILSLRAYCKRFTEDTKRTAGLFPVGTTKRAFTQLTRA